MCVCRRELVSSDTTTEGKPLIALRVAKDRSATESRLGYRVWIRTQERAGPVLVFSVW